MNQADYFAQAQTFRAMLYAEAAKPLGEQAMPTSDTWLRVPAHVACTTTGCPGAQGVECQLGENADGIYRAFCGECGNDHESITLLFDDGPYTVV
jgi:hypothetical protein